MKEKEKLESLCDMANGSFQELGTFSAICHLGENTIAVDTLKNKISIKMDLTPFNLGLENDVFIDMYGNIDTLETSNRGLSRILNKPR